MVSQISVIDTLKALQTNPQSILVDVRTQEEFDFVGIVDSSKINASVLFLPWRNYPDMAIDGAFTEKLSAFVVKIFPDLNPNKLNPNKIDLFFLCRSGVRSLEAAISASKLGYNCHNIVGGFEGSKDSFGNKIDGWKANNLPWITKC